MKGYIYMKCAIITCSEYKKKPFLKPYVVKELSLPVINESVTVINLTYTTERFISLSPKRKEDLCVKICRKLHTDSVFCVYLSGVTDCSEFAQIKYNFHHPDGKSVLRKYAALGAYTLAEQCNLDLSEAKIALYQKKFNHKGFEILCDFAQYFKNITIIGNNLPELEEYSSRLMEYYGLSVNIASKITFANSCDLLFLLDNAGTLSLSEKTVVVDLTKTHFFHCLNTAKFELPIGFNKILPYFTMFDDSCIEFILYMTNSYSSNKEAVFKKINDFGGKFKTFCAKSKITLDKR